MNTTKLKLTNPTDDELSAAVAEHVDGWTDAEIKITGTGVFYGQTDVPPYSISADAVLPLLEKHGPYVSIENTGAGWIVTISNYECKNVSGLDRVFARAGSIALLRANGIEVEQTAQPTRASS